MQRMSGDNSPVYGRLSYLRRGSVFILLITLLLVACGAPTPSSGVSDAPATPPPPLVMAGDFSSIRSLDPAMVYEVDGFLVVGNLYETLVSYEPGTLEVQGVLAQSWDIAETSSGWVITFTLDEQATFASGNPVTAADVIFSWQRVLDLNGPPAFLFTDIAHLTSDAMRAVDPQTVEVTLPATTDPQVFLAILSFSVAAVVEQQAVLPHAEDDHGSAWLSAHAAGSGAYVLEQWVRGERIVLTARPDPWQSPPAIPQVVLQYVTELSDMQALIASGEADIVQDLSAVQAEALADNPEVQVVAAPTLDLVYIGMNITDTLPLRDPAVRQAIRTAINYDDLATLLRGNAQMVQEIIPAGIPGHTGQQFVAHDSQQARDLLAEAGFAEGIELDLLTPPGPAPGGTDWRTLAAKLQHDLAQVGITLNVQQSDQLLDVYRAQQHELVMTLWSPDFPDADANVTPFIDFDARSLAWRNQWRAPDLVDLARQAAREPDDVQRMNAYETLMERVTHEGPYAVLYQPSRLFGVRRTVDGFAYTAADTPMITFSRLTRVAGVGEE